MLKVMLVDDEPIIIKGLKKMIDWENNGCQIVGEAYDGEDAIQMAEEKSPDLVITDLVMPEMDGIEFITRLNEVNKNTKVIILSGYGEFEYARKALKNGVFEYLLKPVTKEQLLDAIKKVSEVIASEDKFVFEIQKLRKQIKESVPLLREQFLIQLMQGKIKSKEKVAKKCRLLDIDLSGDHYAVLAVYIENISENEKFQGEDGELLLRYAAENMIEEIIKSRDKGFIISPGEEIYVLLIREKGYMTSQEIRQTAQILKEYLKIYLDAEVTIGIGRQYTRVLQVSDSYHEAGIALHNKFFTGTNMIIFYKQFFAKTKEECVFYPEMEEEKILDLFKNNQNEVPQSIIEDLVDGFVKYSGNRIEFIYNFCFEFCVQLRKVILSYYGEIKIPYFDLYIMNDKIRQCTTVHELKNFMEHLFTEVNTGISVLRSSREYDVIEEAKRFISENFSRYISLSSVAAKVCMSPAYFSVLFKNRAGENYYDYLVRVRMEEAAKLLQQENNCKVYEIALKVGYKNARSFSEAFKRFYGVIPSTYKEKLRSTT